MAPLEIACPACEETGCDQCQHSGSFQVTDCPKRVLDAELVEAIKFAELFLKGLPLVPGGIIAHSAWFMSLVDHWQYESNLAEAEHYRKIRNR